jgi:hypothetical protein
MNWQTMDTHLEIPVKMSVYVITDGEIGNLDERANIYMLNSKLRIRINTICIQGRSDFLNGI